MSISWKINVKEKGREKEKKMKIVLVVGGRSEIGKLAWFIHMLLVYYLAGTFHLACLPTTQ
jgi:hypothetical protein